MPYCPKCGAEVKEEMAFCPKCGAPLKGGEVPAEAKPAAAPRKDEKAEKHEKTEKREKAEKHEKHEIPFIGPLIGGLILIFLGVMSYLSVIGLISKEVIGAMFLILIGIVVIVLGLVAMRRHPKP